MSAGPPTERANRKLAGVIAELKAETTELDNRLRDVTVRRGRLADVRLATSIRRKVRLLEACIASGEGA